MRGDTSTSNPASYCLAVHLRNLKGWEMAWPAVARLTTLNSWGKFRAALEDGRLPHGKRVGCRRSVHVVNSLPLGLFCMNVHRKLLQVCGVGVAGAAKSTHASQDLKATCIGANAVRPQQRSGRIDTSLHTSDPQVGPRKTRIRLQ